MHNNTLFYRSRFYSLIFFLIALMITRYSWADINKQWSLGGMSEPESVLVNEEKQVLYVSNMNGQPLEDNGNGYISLVSVDGRMLKEKWVTGLGAPKGLALQGGLLYVADLQTIHIIDHKQGRLLQSIKVHDSKLLNDIAIDSDGNVYVTDLLGGGIYRLKDRLVEKWVSADILVHPNGIFYDDKHLLVATWGQGLRDDFSTKVLGSLYRLDLKTGAVVLLKGAETFGNLDGIVKVGDQIIVNDWMSGDVFSYYNHSLKKLFNAGKHAADIGSWKNQLLVPMMFDSRVDSYKIK